jgi:hypothetical protein
MGAIMIVKMAGGTVTGVINLLPKLKDYSGATPTIQIALRHELQAPHRYARDNLAMLVIWIGMVTGLVVNNTVFPHRNE